MTFEEIEAEIEAILNAEPEPQFEGESPEEYEARKEQFVKEQFEAIDVYGNLEKEKVDGIALYIKKEEALQELWARESKRLADKKKASENRVKSFKQYLLGIFEKEGKIVDGKLSIKGNFNSLSMRTSKNVVDVIDEDAIPEELWNERVIREVSKTKVKEAILAGAEVPGARLKETYSLVIK